MMILSREPVSGLEPAMCVDRMHVSLRTKRRTNGYMFQNARGKQAKIGNYEDEFLDRMVGARIARPSLFDPGVNVTEVYSLRRSLRRGSTTRARNQGVPEALIEMNNRWRKVESARGRRPGMSMMAHYREIRLSIPLLWRYTRML